MITESTAGSFGPQDPPAHLTRCSLRLTSDKIRRYGALTEDPNPIHYDAAFAAGTSFGQPIAQGTPRSTRSGPPSRQASRRKR